MDELLNLTDTEILQLAESACSDLKDLNEENFIYTVRWIEDVLLCAGLLSLLKKEKIKVSGFEGSSPIFSAPIYEKLMNEINSTLLESAEKYGELE
jgi:hypothetical protein